MQRERRSKLEEKKDLLMFKDKPLIRKESLMYYGFMDDKYIVMMQVLESRNVNGLKLSTRVKVELQSTDPNVKSKDRILKKTEKDGLYAAMDVASVWLERALSAK